MNPRQKKIEQIERLAADAFREHEIHRHLFRIESNNVYRHFRCKRPNTGNYAFHISTFPGRLVVAGDIGCLIVERVSDMFEWVPQNLRDIQYFAQKVPSEMPTTEYDSAMAMEFISECAVAEGTESELAKKSSELEDLIDNEYEFKIALNDSGLIDGCDWPTLTNWTSSFLWCREALKWFFSKYDLESERHDAN